VQKLSECSERFFAWDVVQKNRFAQFLHSGQSFWDVVQKTASLNFCTPDNLFGMLCKKPLRSIFALRTIFLGCCAKNRFAQFLHSGQSFWDVVQKTASLNFCTPDNLFGMIWPGN